MRGIAPNAVKSWRASGACRRGGVDGRADTSLWDESERAMHGGGPPPRVPAAFAPMNEILSHHARESLSLSVSYARRISLKRSSDSSTRCWFLSEVGREREVSPVVPQKEQQR